MRGTGPGEAVCCEDKDSIFMDIQEGAFCSIGHTSSPLFPTHAHTHMNRPAKNTHIWFLQHGGRIGRVVYRDGARYCFLECPFTRFASLLGHLSPWTSATSSRAKSVPGDRESGEWALQKMVASSIPIYYCRTYCNYYSSSI